MARLVAILLSAALVGGCAYFPTPPDPIRVVDSPADVGSCRNLGRIGAPVPTNGTAPVVISSLTIAVPARSAKPDLVLGAIPDPAPASGPGFVYHLNAMRDAALSRGATDLLLRRVHRDNSYVQGVAYRCPH